MKLRKILSLGLVLIVVISSIMVGVVSVGAASIDKAISVDQRIPLLNRRSRPVRGHFRAPGAEGRKEVPGD